MSAFILFSLLKVPKSAILSHPCVAIYFFQGVTQKIFGYSYLCGDCSQQSMFWPLGVAKSHTLAIWLPFKLHEDESVKGQNEERFL